MPQGLNLQRAPRWIRQAVFGGTNLGTLKPAVHIVAQAADPTGATQGSLWARSGTLLNQLRYHNGTRAVIVPGVLTGSKTHDFASVADAATTAATTVTVTGAAVGDSATCSLTTLTTGKVKCLAEVTAADTVSCWLQNNSGGAVDAASGTLRATVLKFE